MEEEWEGEREGYCVGALCSLRGFETYLPPYDDDNYNFVGRIWPLHVSKQRQKLSGILWKSESNSKKIGFQFEKELFTKLY